MNMFLPTLCVLYCSPRCGPSTCVREYVHTCVHAWPVLFVRMFCSDNLILGHLYMRCLMSYLSAEQCGGGCGVMVNSSLCLPVSPAGDVDRPSSSQQHPLTRPAHVQRLSKLKLSPVRQQRTTKLLLPKPPSSNTWVRGKGTVDGLGLCLLH